jgi:hypothetical protein
MSRRRKALHLLRIAAPFLCVCQAEKNGPQGYPFISRGGDRGKSFRRNADADSKRIFDKKTFDELDDMLNSFNSQFSAGDEGFDLESEGHDYEDEPHEDNPREELSSSGKGALYDAYNQLHTLAQVRHPEKVLCCHVLCASFSHTISRTGNRTFESRLTHRQS